MCFFDFFCTLQNSFVLRMNQIEIERQKDTLDFKTLTRGTTYLEKIIC
jgi:hypothetical protein